MKRIFLTLALFSGILLIAAFALGLGIGDPQSRSEAVQNEVAGHFLTAVAALVFASLVHAIVLTYFMGTGRWIEETTAAYRLSDEYRAESRSLKFQTIPAMVLCLVLLLATGALGASADPAASVASPGWLGVSAATLHFLFATITIGINLAVNIFEYVMIERNGTLIALVMQQVRRIRQSHGLPV